MESVMLDAAGHRRSPATMPGYDRGRLPRNEGEQYPADPLHPTSSEALRRYTWTRDQPCPTPRSDASFLSSAGTSPAANLCHGRPPMRLWPRPRGSHPQRPEQPPTTRVGDRPDLPARPDVSLHMVTNRPTRRHPRPAICTSLVDPAARRASGLARYRGLLLLAPPQGGLRTLHGHSRSVTRAPRTEMTASPTPNTSAAQIAPLRSPGGRAGHIHGVCQPALIASSAKARYASGPIQESEPPIMMAESKPTPAIPMTFRRSAVVPPRRSAPAAPARSEMNAATVSPTAAPRRRYGSHVPVARLDSPNGLRVVTATVAAAAASTISGTWSERSSLCQRSVAWKSAPHATITTSAAGARRLRRCNRTRRPPAADRRRARLLECAASPWATWNPHQPSLTRSTPRSTARGDATTTPLAVARSPTASRQQHPAADTRPPAPHRQERLLQHVLHVSRRHQRPQPRRQPRPMAKQELSQRSVVPARNPPDQQIVVHQTPIALNRRSVHDDPSSPPPPTRRRHVQCLDVSGIDRHCSPLPARFMSTSALAPRRWPLIEAGGASVLSPRENGRSRPSPLYCCGQAKGSRNPPADHVSRRNPEPPIASPDSLGGKQNAGISHVDSAANVAAMPLAERRRFVAAFAVGADQRGHDRW